MKETFRLFIVILSVITNVFEVNAQNNPKIDLLNQYIEDARIKWNIPAIAVGIIHYDTIVLLEGYGEREIGTGKTVSDFCWVNDIRVPTQKSTVIHNFLIKKI